MTTIKMGTMVLKVGKGRWQEPRAVIMDKGISEVIKIMAVRTMVQAHLGLTTIKDRDRDRDRQRRMRRDRLYLVVSRPNLLPLYAT